MSAAGLLAARERPLNRANHLHVLTLELQFHRQLEQPCCARIARVKTVAEARRRVTSLRAVVDELFCRIVARIAAADHREAAIEIPHARLDVAAVVRTERQDARRDAVL